MLLTVKLVRIILSWVGWWKGMDGWVKGGWLDLVKIRPTQPSQAEARLGFWLG